jgi:hypothetical protein
MKQARIYCPFMRTLDDSNFDIKKQELNLELAKKYTEERFRIRWKLKDRYYIND